MPIEAGATYVFDLGYYDFGFWADLDGKDCRFVTRLKKNTPVTAVAERPVPTGTTIVCDKIVRLPKRLARSRKNPFAKDGRMVTVTIDTGKTLKLFTNDLDSPAEAIADLYKTRWQIELFFRWIKQNLKIRRFHGRSANAVRLQVAAAIITYLLLKLLHNAAKDEENRGALLRKRSDTPSFIASRYATLVGRIERRQGYLSLAAAALNSSSPCDANTVPDSRDRASPAIHTSPQAKCQAEPRGCADQVRA